MVTTTDPKLAEWLRRYRNYGKVVENGKVSYSMTDGFNFRMNEVTAALGVVQMQRLPEILAWKRNLAAKYDQIFDKRIHFPQGMTSGYYKYIVFDTPLKEETGKVFNISDFGNVIENLPADIPNSCWIAKHHRCAPIWYGWPQSDKPIEELRRLLA